MRFARYLRQLDELVQELRAAYQPTIQTQRNDQHDPDSDSRRLAAGWRSVVVVAAVFEASCHPAATLPKTAQEHSNLSARAGSGLPTDNSAQQPPTSCPNAQPSRAAFDDTWHRRPFRFARDQRGLAALRNFRNRRSSG